MEGKKSNFFVNIADKWSTVEPSRKKFIIIVGISLGSGNVSSNA